MGIYLGEYERRPWSHNAKKMATFIVSVTSLVLLAVFWSEAWALAAAFAADSIGFVRGFSMPRGTPEHEASWSTLRFVGGVMAVVLGIMAIALIMEANEVLRSGGIVLRFKRDDDPQRK